MIQVCPNCAKSLPGDARFCQYCGAPLPWLGSDGGDIVATGYSTVIKAGQINIGHQAREAGPRQHHEDCPICGRANLVERTFRCKACGRAGMCLDHMDKRALVCVECVASMRGTVTTFLVGLNAVIHQGNYYRFGESMTDAAWNDFDVSRWEHMRDHGVTYPDGREIHSLSYFSLDFEMGSVTLDSDGKIQVAVTCYRTLEEYTVDQYGRSPRRDERVLGGGFGFVLVRFSNGWQIDHVFP